jgi:hypothetical protein
VKIVETCVEKTRFQAPGNIVARSMIQHFFSRRLLCKTYDFGIVFFWLTGSLNNINVLQRSHLFARLASDDAPTCNYIVNGHEYNMGHYLADGIYSEWATFVKTIRVPENRVEAEFAKAQEASQKDIKRALGVLQARFAIV